MNIVQVIIKAREDKIGDINAKFKNIMSLTKLLEVLNSFFFSPSSFVKELNKHGQYAGIQFSIPVSQFDKSLQLIKIHKNTFGFSRDKVYSVEFSSM